MTDTATPVKKRKPRAKKEPAYTEVLDTASRLNLGDKVNLVKALKESITTEVASANARAKAASELTSNL